MISALTVDSVLDSPMMDGSVTVRKAAMKDIQPILDLINSYAAKGIMLPRTEFELSENIRDFSVAYSGDKLVGCGALHFYSPVMGEVRSLAVSPDHRAHGIGLLLVESLVGEAQLFRLDALFAFTYVPGFFAKMGFYEVERGELPLKAWKDCLRCPKFHSCDEIAVLRVLAPERWITHHVQPSAGLLDAAEQVLVQLPTIKSPENR
ncbi:MAG TPA: N-acetyltransferase [Bryobacteraceae bacterium]|jgi:amino-acid N-acetyltransferase